MAGPGQARFYSSTFVQTSLASGIAAGTLTFNVGTTTGAPGTPFVVSVDQNTASEELMLVTNISGLQYTVTRGVGGTSAVSHANGASVVHVMYAQDLTDASAHIGAFDAVHGLSSGSLVVGTTDAQTLTNKTLTAPTINTPSISTATLTGTTTSGAINASALITAPDIKASGLTGATSATRYVGATASGAPASGNFSQGDFIISEDGLIWVCTATGSPGTWNALLGANNTQTLSNKTLTSPTLNGTPTGNGNMTQASYAASGLTGAINASRYAGATTTGSPSTGAFLLGDFVIDQTGLIWICTVSGSPGTWVALVNTSATQSLTGKTLNSPVLSGTMTGSGAININAAIIGTVLSASSPGANTFTAYAGGTAGGPPTAGTFAQGHFVIDRTGQIWFCTVPGTPGTWTSLSQSDLQGAGYSTNIVTGGSNRTSTQSPFTYSSSKTVTVSAGSGWTATFSDATFHGCGSFAVTPGGTPSAGTLGFLSVHTSNCNITSNQLTLGGAAFTEAAAGVATSTTITVNVTASAW